MAHFTHTEEDAAAFVLQRKVERSGNPQVLYVLDLLKKAATGSELVKATDTLNNYYA